MRFLVAVLLVGTALAGCADLSDPTSGDLVTDNLFEYVPGPGSHPAFGFPTRNDLPLVGSETPGWPAGWKQPTGVALPDDIQGLVAEGTVPGVGSGAGITIFGSYAFVGSYNSQDLWAVDISDLGDPQVVGHLAGVTNAGDLETIAYPPSEEHPDGQLVIVVSTRSQVMNVIDATDPANMTLLSVIEAGGNHNHQIVPGTPLVYNAHSGGIIDIWDLSDPANPIKVLDFANDHGCHAIDFFINTTEGKFFGFCAAYQVTQIFDITDPRDPQMLSSVPYPLLNQDTVAPVVPANPSFSHLATANHDGTVMIMGDETGGGAAPGCDLHARDPVTGQSATGPLGNLYFYDITDPTNPVLHGAVSPSAYEQRGSCTAHFGAVIEDRNQLVMAFYTVGVVLVDFTDLDNPYIMDTGGRDETDTPCTLCGTWDAQYYRGHVITGDVDKGMGLLSFS